MENTSEATTEPQEAKAEEHTPESLATEFRNIADKYMVPMSDGTIKDIANMAVDGGRKLAAFEDHMKTVAKGMYSAFAPQIDAGIPTFHLLEPYRQVAKMTLGEDYEPNFMSDIKAQAVLHGDRDEKTGTSRPMTMDQWRQHIRTEPSFGWGFTQEAHDMANSLLQTLGKAFGKI